MRGTERTRAMREGYEAVCFDLYGTLVDGRGLAAAQAGALLGRLPAGRWAVVTSAPRELAQRLLTQAGLPWPAHLIAAQDVAQSKPAPEGYLLAARLLGAQPSRCLAVEDSPQGVTAALSAGMEVAAIGLPGCSGRAGVIPLNELREIERWLDPLTLRRRRG